MDPILTKAIATANFSRFRPGRSGGFYESFFQRANHPSRPLAFWIRYTVFNPQGKPENAMGELWAIYFDGEKNEHFACKQEFPIAECRLNTTSFSVKIGATELGHGYLSGGIRDDYTWNLNFSEKESPLFLLPLTMYDTPFPSAKALVGNPLTSYSGELNVQGQTIAIRNWIGSQNHNWGTRHTDRYAWGQVAGFDNAPGSFLELGTAQLKLGPVFTPKMTVLCLRHNGKEYRLNNLLKTFANKADYAYFKWDFEAQDEELKVKGNINAKHDDFVGLNYYNPPGGSKTCLNTKIASCELDIQFKDGKRETLYTQHRAAFEILTDDKEHGVNVRC